MYSDRRPRLSYVGEDTLPEVLWKTTVDHRFVLFVGPPGSGKTSTEIEVSRALRENGLTLRRFAKFSSRQLRAKELMGKVRAQPVSDPDWWKAVLHHQRCLATSIVGTPPMYDDWEELGQRYGICVPTIEAMGQPKILPEFLAAFLLDDPEGICLEKFGIESLNKACREAEECGERISVELSWRHAEDWVRFFPHSDVILMEVKPWVMIGRAREKWSDASVVGQARKLDALSSMRIYERGDYSYHNSILAVCQANQPEQLKGNVQLVTNLLSANWERSCPEVKAVLAGAA